MAVTDTETAQFPDPDAEFTVAQGTGLCVVHAHPAPVLIDTLVSELPPGTEIDVWVTE